MILRDLFHFSNKEIFVDYNFPNECGVRVNIGTLAGIKIGNPSLQIKYLWAGNESRLHLNYLWRYLLFSQYWYFLDKKEFSDYYRLVHW